MGFTIKGQVIRAWLFNKVFNLIMLSGHMPAAICPSKCNTGNLNVLHFLYEIFNCADNGFSTASSGV